MLFPGRDADVVVCGAGAAGMATALAAARAGGAVCLLEASGTVLEAGRLVERTIEHDGHLTNCQPRAVIDATGTAEVVRRAAPALVEQEAHLPAGGLVLRLRGVAPGAVAFPQNLAVVRALQS